MRTHLTRTAPLAGVTVLALALTAACGTDSDPGGGGDGSLTVAATPVPHAEILTFVRDNLAEDAGLELTVQDVNDYRLPNTSVADGDVDANFFQHGPFLEEFNEEEGTDIVPVVNVHLEPLGLYSHTAGDLADLGPGATVAIPDDATNGGRALHLLAEHGLIELADGVGAEATRGDVTDDGGLELNELEAATLPRALDDVDAAVINGNYALGAELSPAEDALALESAEDNPYANFLAVLAENEDDEDVQTLAELLNSPEVEEYIEEQYAGSVIPAFGAPTS